VGELYYIMIAGCVCLKVWEQGIGSFPGCLGSVLTASWLWAPDQGREGEPSAGEALLWCDCSMGLDPHVCKQGTAAGASFSFPWGDFKWMRANSFNRHLSQTW
jgi:hypothetical protein